MGSALDEPTLILNRNWQAITFLPVRTSIVTVMRDMGSVLDTENYLLLSFEEWAESNPKTDRWIKTANGQLPAPDIVVLKRFGEKPPRKVTFNRVNLATRDHWNCQYCGVPLKENRQLTVDHVLPKSRGGPTSWENCITACNECNSRKSNFLPEEIGMKLRSKPTKPNWKPKLLPPRGITRAAWVPFLEKA